MGVGRRRHGRHRFGLRALPDDAGEWRHARWQTLSRPKNNRLHDVGPHRRRDHAGALLPARTGLWLRIRLRGAQGGRRRADTRLGWRLQWGGAGGTYFWVDPKENMFVVFAMQSPRNRVPFRQVLRDMVYAAIEKPASHTPTD